MARYIDAEALTAEFKRLTLGENSLVERIFADGVYSVIDTFPAAEVVEVKKGEILLPLGIEELRHLINDAIFYIRMMENRNRNKAEFGYFERQELLEKLKNVERYYEMLNMPVCKKDEEDTGGGE